jgi:hypothetical protein
MKSVAAFASLCLVLAPAAAHAQVIFNDNFNGSSTGNNNGAGAINPTSNTSVFSTGGDSGSQTITSGGAALSPGSGYGSQWLTSFTGNNGNNQAFALGSTGTDFSFTVNNVNVSANGGNNRGDIPNSANGGFRFELGMVSANAGYGDPELYTNVSGGIYVYLFYDQQGNLTGDVRATDSTKPGGGDSSGIQGIYELASFDITQPVGTTSSYNSPLTVNFDLTSTGYAISFSQTATVLSGSLTGSFNTTEQGDFSNGVRTNILGQGWSNGDGSGDVREFEASIAPEPPVVYLLGLGTLALAFVGFRRATSRA